MVKCIWNLISDVYRSFSACYTFKSCIYNFYPASVFIFSFFNLPAVRMSFTASPKDVQSHRREVSFVLWARDAGEVWREVRKEKSHKHYGGERAK